MTTDERLTEAEADLEQLVHRAMCAIPTLKRAVEDVTDWRRDIRKELVENLEKATNQAHANQIQRRRLREIEDFVGRGRKAQEVVDGIIADHAAKPESEGKSEPDPLSRPATPGV